MTEDREVRANLNHCTVEVLYSEQLGVGSYGAVYRAKCDELLCAAKVLHPILFADGDVDGEARLVRQFDQECHFLKDLRHPNVVQYLGMYTEGNTRILLMELMDGNLTRFLEEGPLTYHTAINISYDIALALAYLHSIYIIHRDLSSNNVLLLGNRRAKVSDFGVSKFIDPRRQRQSSLTMCPGNSAYMPPEAIDEAYTASYSEKLDCFSYGVLCVQMLTRKFPAPTSRLVAAADSANMRVVVSEIERRREHIDLIDETHPFLVTILQCLCDSEEERPSAQEICHRLVRLRDERRYADSERDDNALEPTAPRRDRDDERRRYEEIEELQQLLRQSQVERDQLRQQMRRSRAEITRKNYEIEEKTRTIAELERERLHKTQEIDELTASTSEVHQQLLRSEQHFQTDVIGYEQTIREKDTTITKLTLLVAELQEELKRKEKLIYQQRAPSKQTSPDIRVTSIYGGETPHQMRREPDATIFQNIVYFKFFWGKYVISYDIDGKKWDQLPPCPNSSFSIAVIGGHLTIIGGKTPNLDPTNSLLSFMNSEWTEEFPPMPTKRYWTIAVSFNDSVIVLGGETERRTVLCTVEVLHSKSKHWSVACSLPQPFDSATATVCSQRLYLACGSSETTARVVLSCSIFQLLETCRPAKSGHTLRVPGLWNRLFDLPFQEMTITSLNDRLLAVGGKKKCGSPTSAIFVYDDVKSTWHEIGDLKVARSSCFAVSLPRNEVIMVVGGLVNESGAETTTCNKVEFLAISQA